MSGSMKQSSVSVDNGFLLSVSKPSYFAQFNKLLIHVSSLLLLSILLIACSISPTTPSTAKGTPSPPTTTPVPPGTLLYQSDWSRGLDTWQATKGWKQSGKNVQTEPLANLSLTVPYQPRVADYAIEVQLQIVQVAESGGYVALTADQQPGKDGYNASVQNLLAPGKQPNGSHPHIQAYIDPLGSMDRESFETSDYEPGTHWHTFRIEVRESQVSFLVDANTVSHAISTKTNFLSDGPLHLKSSQVILRVGTLRITTL